MTKKIRYSEEHFRLLYERTPIPYQSLDSDGHLIEVNKAWLDILGYTREEVLGRWFGDFLAPEMVDLFRERFPCFKKAGEVHGYEFDMVRKDGTYIKVSFEGRIGHDKHGNFSQTHCVFTDITEHKRTETLLRKSEERYRRITEAITNYLYTVTVKNGRPAETKHSETCIAVTGYSSTEFADDPYLWIRMVPEEDRDLVRKQAEDALSGHSPEPVEHRIIRKDGKLCWVESSMVPFYDISGDLISYDGIVRDITERKQAEEMLRESEDKFAKAFHSSPIAVGITGLSDGKFIEVNESLTRILGFSIEETIGHTTLELNIWWNPEDRSRYISALKRDGFVHNMEVLVRTKSGGSATVLMSSELINIAGQDCMLSAFYDITDRKRASEMLRESEERFRQIAISTEEWIWEINSDGLYTYSNSVVENILGYKPEEIVGKKYFYDFFLPDSMEEMKKAAFETFTGKKAFVKFVNSNLHKNGGIIILETSGLPILDSDGNLLGYRGVDMDITERKLAEEMIKEREFELLQAQHIANIGSWTYDPLTQNPTWSEGMFHIWGLDPKLGPPHYSEHQKYIHPDDFQRFDDAVREAVELGKPYKLELRICRPDGIEKIIISICEPQLNSAGKVVKLRGTIQDITERRKIEEQLRQAQKMEAIGVLAGGVAHDFNNILSAILGYASLLEKKIPVEDPLHTYINVIIDSSEKAADLVQSLLTFSRKRIMELQKINLNDIVLGMHKLLNRVISEDIEIKVTTTDTDLIVQADKVQIEQTLMNLVTNARDAMPQGGTLTVATEETEIDEQFIPSHQFGKTGRYAVITVADTGAGMDKKTMKNIFEPFFTTKEVGKGTGLGLAMVYGTIKQHEGFIDVDSEPGRGTDFRIYLPLSEYGVEIKEEEVSVPVQSGNETILIVEDDRSVREIIRSVLEDFGYKVLEAVDGEDGLNIFTEHKENIQLIISDVVMPKKHGGAMFIEARKIKPDIKIIFMTGYSADFVDSKSLLEREAHFIYKPVKPDNLLRKIREVLDNK